MSMNSSNGTQQPRSFNTLFTPEIGKRYSKCLKYQPSGIDIMNNPDATVIDRLKVLRQMVCFYYPTYCKLQGIPKSEWQGKFLHQINALDTIPFAVTGATDTSPEAVAAIEKWLLKLSHGLERTVNTRGPNEAEVSWILGNPYEPSEAQYRKHKQVA